MNIKTCFVGVVHLSGYLMEDDQYPDDFGESMMDESSEEESDEDEGSY